MASRVVLVGGGQPTKLLSEFALQTDITDMVKTDDIADMVKTDDIADMVKTADLATYATKGQVDIDDGTGVPTSASDPGTAGTFIISADTIYVCIATDTWVKAALAWE